MASISATPLLYHLCGRKAKGCRLQMPGLCTPRPCRTINGTPKPFGFIYAEFSIHRLLIVDYLPRTVPEWPQEPASFFQFGFVSCTVRVLILIRIALSSSNKVSLFYFFCRVVWIEGFCRKIISSLVFMNGSGCAASSTELFPGFPGKKTRAL